MGDIVLMAVLVIAYLLVVGACIVAFLRKEEEIEAMDEAASKAGRRHGDERVTPLADAAPETLSPPVRSAREVRTEIRERAAPPSTAEGSAGTVGSPKPRGAGRPGLRARASGPTARTAAEPIHG